MHRGLMHEATNIYLCKPSPCSFRTLDYEMHYSLYSVQLCPCSAMKQLIYIITHGMRYHICVRVPVCVMDTRVQCDRNFQGLVFRKCYITGPSVQCTWHVRPIARAYVCTCVTVCAQSECIYTWDNICLMSPHAHGVFMCAVHSYTHMEQHMLYRSWHCAPCVIVTAMICACTREM